MRNLILIICGLYFLGFLFFFVMEAASGPVTLPLALVRAIVWPIYWPTGWPYGTPARMD